MPLPEITPRFTDRPAYNLIVGYLNGHLAPNPAVLFRIRKVPRSSLDRRTATLSNVSFFRSFSQMLEQKPESGQDRLLIILSDKTYRMAQSD
jgi:hypothetical protein